MNSYVLFVERVDQLRKDFKSNDFLGEIVAVTCQSSESKGSTLLDAMYIIEKKWSQQGHNT